ncbi:MAG TPA: hypothetical protein EYP58_01715 [bacterium (Candidatus Stahlbacteria)]|nr:hypothetical protein [Candidatus Stahlbacteria bacterium]
MSLAAKERILDILIILAAIGLAVVIIYPQYKMSQPTKVKIAIDRTVVSLPILVAQEKGYFANEKVIVELSTVEDPYERSQGLTNGQYVFTVLPWSYVLDEEHPYRVIGSAETRQLKPAEALLAVSKRRVKEVRDLRGKKIGLLPETEHYFDELKANLPSRVTKIQKVFIEPDEIIGAISNNRVHALFLFEPYRSLAINYGAKVIQDAPLAYFVQRSYPVAAFCFAQDFIERDNIGARRIKTAIDAAFRHIIRNTGEAKKLMYEKQNFEESLLHASLVEFQRLREINREALQSYAHHLDLPVVPDSVIANPVEFER